MKKIIVVNLLGSNEAEKAIMARQMSSQLKKKGHNCCFIRNRRYLTSDENFKIIVDKLCLMGNESYRAEKDKNRVDVVITDSPMLLSVFHGCLYGKVGYTFDELQRLSEYCKSNFYNLNFFIKNAAVNDNNQGNYDLSSLTEEKAIFNLFRGVDLNMETVIPNEFCFQRMMEEIEGEINRSSELKLVAEA